MIFFSWERGVESTLAKAAIPMFVSLPFLIIYIPMCLQPRQHAIKMGDIQWRGVIGIRVGSQTGHLPPCTLIAQNSFYSYYEVIFIQDIFLYRKIWKMTVLQMNKQYEIYKYVCIYRWLLQQHGFVMNSYCASVTWSENQHEHSATTWEEHFELSSFLSFYCLLIMIGNLMRIYLSISYP